ncbi:hypothetical protein GLAREA_07537 [Glarea lozoyensis ATCC 20868]|uniref:Uncharacterized protein n=1 Tax=Glarea lozoyensis (strain ATCC 20868 / MF5171) TaxID=1116229 RepID=S3D5L2_GLAL2|nr:uncharacterized protein GLAREA_07537 [Glarea lozoyensis ATCC 20868]EPE32404.1 hypothetical protein GLAREA_07537 [Glarea lozoyensis ATCC 20868]
MVYRALQPPGVASDRCHDKMTASSRDSVFHTSRTKPQRPNGSRPRENPRNLGPEETFHLTMAILRINNRAGGGVATLRVQYQSFPHPNLELCA